MNKFVIGALLGSASAITTISGPDVYGPNGDGYTNNSPDYETSRIGIDVTEAGTGPKCKAGDWTTVHWSGKLKDGREITNSRAEPGGQPRTFALGAREVYHCWDLAIPQLHQGAKATLHCPSYLVFGATYIWAPLGGEPVPLHSDVDFEIEVVECNRVPEFTEQVPQPQTTTMQPGRCMYLHSVEGEEEATPLVITCENEDRIHAPGFNYFPAVPCYLEEWVKENKHQEFHMTDSGLIKDAAHEWELCSQAGYLALCDWASYHPNIANRAFRDQHIDWLYDGVSQTLQHHTEWGSQFPYVDHTVKWAEIYMDSHTWQDAGPLENANAKFRIEYCWKNF